MSFILPAILMNISSIMLSNITSSIYNINSYILKDTSENAIKVADFIREFDILHKIKTITEFIDSIQSNTHVINAEIESIKICINDINVQLKIIEQRLDYNKNIWILSSIRSFGFDNRIKELTILMKVLNDRFNMLLLIYNNNNNTNNTNNVVDDHNIPHNETDDNEVMPGDEIFECDDILP